MRTVDKLNKLVELYERDHGGCEDTTCGMHHAMQAGYDLVALERWSGSGAACDEFYDLYSTLPKTYKMFGRKHDKQVNEFIKEVPIKPCECGAYIYNPDDCDGHCSSCGRQLKEYKRA